MWDKSTYFFESKDSDVFVKGYSAFLPRYGQDFRKLIKSSNLSETFDWSDDLPILEKPICRWYEAGWVEPIFFADVHDQPSAVYPDLYRLVAARGLITLKRSGMINKVYGIRACVSPPHAILIKPFYGFLNIIRTGQKSYNITCNDCVIINCINPDTDGAEVIIIVNQPSYVIISVTIHTSRYEDLGLEAL